MLQMLTRACLTKPVLSLQKKVWGMVENSSTCTTVTGVVIAEEGMGNGRKQFNLHIITVDNHP